MNRARFPMAALLAISFVTVAVPLADAGGGMGGGDDFTRACRTISNGVNPPQVLELTMDTIPGTTVVQVGPPILLCDLLVSGRTVNQAPATVFIQDPTNMVCYPVNAAAKPKQTVTITDPFSASVNQSQQVTLGGVSVLCVPAIVNFGLIE